MNANYLVSGIPSLLELIALVVGVALVASRAVGPRRRLGVIGLVVMAVVVVLRGTLVFVFPLLYRAFGTGSATAYGAVNGLLTLVWIGGLGLVIAALVARDPYPTQPPPYQR